jgi:toxin HigB-1
MKAVFAPSFDRSLKKIFRRHPELRSTFWEKVKLFQQSPFHTSLRTHSLGGKLNRLRSFSITHEIRVIFEFTPDGNAVFTDIGEHKEVY